MSFISIGLDITYMKFLLESINMRLQLLCHAVNFHEIHMAY